jgi:subtilisin family serine protease
MKSMTNRSRFVILFSLVALVSTLLSFSASAGEDSAEDIREEHSFDQLIIGYTDQETSIEKIAVREKSRRDVSAISFESISPRDSRTEVVKLGKNISVKEAIRRLKGQPGIRFVEPDYIVYALTAPNDPYFASTATPLWGMRGSSSVPANPYGSNAASAWDLGYVGNSNVAVGVVDEGIQVLHPDLVGNIWRNPKETAGDRIDNDGNGYVDDINGWNFVNNNGAVYGGRTLDAHGTHVAGTIGAKGNNATGVVGVNWNANIISAKFLAATGGTTSNAIKAIDYLTDLKRRGLANIVAINNSWGGGGSSQALLDAINRAGDQNILFIAAAGNSGLNNDASASYPSNYVCDNAGSRGWDCVVAVASINSTGDRSTFSNFGLTTVDLGAPGEDIWSTIPGGYLSYSGTSMATPHVTGAAALCESINPRLSAKQIRDAITSTVANTPSLLGSTATNGRLDVGAMASACFAGTYLPLSLANTSTPQVLPAGVVGTAYSQKIVTLNGTGLNTWSVTVGATPSILPPGLTLLGGVIAGTPTTAGTFTPTIRVTDGSTIIDRQVNITVSSTPPGAFTLTAPINAATRQSLTPKLSWGTSTNATEYQYCISITPGCSPTISTGTNRNVTVNGLTAATRYFWTVRSKNADGQFTTTSSGERSFTTR